MYALYNLIIESVSRYFLILDRQYDLKSQIYRFLQLVLKMSSVYQQRCPDIYNVVQSQDQYFLITSNTASFSRSSLFIYRHHNCMYL